VADLGFSMGAVENPSLFSPSHSPFLASPSCPLTFVFIIIELEGLGKWCEFPQWSLCGAPGWNWIWCIL